MRFEPEEIKKAQTEFYKGDRKNATVFFAIIAFALVAGLFLFQQPTTPPKQQEPVSKPIVALDQPYQNRMIANYYESTRMEAQ